MSAGGCLYKNEVVLQHVKETEVRKKERERDVWSECERTILHAQLGTAK